MAKAATKQTKKSTVRPLGEKVLVKRLEAETVTKGGIVLPDTAKEKPQQGEVIALGDGKMLDDGTRAPHKIDVGDTVIFNSYAGTEITVEGESLLLMNENDIMATVD